MKPADLVHDVCSAQRRSLRLLPQGAGLSNSAQLHGTLQVACAGSGKAARVFQFCVSPGTAAQPSDAMFGRPCFALGMLLAHTPQAATQRLFDAIASSDARLSCRTQNIYI